MLSPTSVGIRLLLAVLLCVFFGCRRAGNSGPLDNKTLRMLSEGMMHRPCLGTPNGRRLFDLTDQQARSLVNALIPIESAKVGTLRPDAVDYTLYFQPAMDPVVLRLHLDNCGITYTERQYLYHGGDVQAFRRMADNIIATSPARSGLIIDAAMDGVDKGAEGDK